MTAALVPLMAAMGPWGLVVAMVILFVETGLLLGSFLPGDSLLFTLGVLVAAHTVPLPMWLVIGAAAVAAVAGDQVGYLLGHRYGPRIFGGAHGRLLNQRHAEHAQRFFARYGGWAVVLARFVPVVRGFTPAAAGLARMPARRFAMVNVLGGLAWTTVMLIVGYYAGGIPVVAHHVELLALGLASVGIVPALVVWLRRRARRTTHWRRLPWGAPAPSRGRQGQPPAFLSP